MSGKTENPEQRFELFCEDNFTGVPRRVKRGEPALIIEDPPYNLGQEYSDYCDKKPQQEYLEWLGKRIRTSYTVLHPHGSYWLAINDANAAEAKLLCQSAGFYLRKWLLWVFTFGQNHAKNFTSAHTHWLYFSKNKKNYTFNAGDSSCRVASARQLVYNDKRGNPAGRLPDDVWILRPQEIHPPPDELIDTWFFSRVCGTFKVRADVSPNQMPVPMLERIIRLCSNPNDLVMDDYLGSGSTGEAALRLGRRFVGFDVSKKCVAYADKRLKAITARMASGGDADGQLPLFKSGQLPPAKAGSLRR